MGDFQISSSMSVACSSWIGSLVFSSGELQSGTSFSLSSISRIDTDYFWDEPKRLARSQMSELAFFCRLPCKCRERTCPNDIS